MPNATNRIQPTSLAAVAPLGFGTVIVTIPSRVSFCIIIAIGSAVWVVFHSSYLVHIKPTFIIRGNVEEFPQVTVGNFTVILAYEIFMQHPCGNILSIA